MKEEGFSRVFSLVKEAVEGGSSPKEEELGWIHPSTLARGCLRAAALELLGAPKAPPDSRTRRIFQVGNASHSRILGYLSHLTLAREVSFLDEEHRIKGRCDAVLFVPDTPGKGEFYALEIKTVSSMEYAFLKKEGPREEHLRQCRIYIWGIARYYGLPLQGGLIYYENRDTLEYMLFPVEPKEEELLPLLTQVKAMLPSVREGKLPEERLPPDHPGHRFCPYLGVCEHGQEAIQRPRKIPDAVLAKIIAERIVAKKGKKRREISLLDLEAELGQDHSVLEDTGP